MSTDAALDVQNGLGGLGVVIRDCNGQIMVVAIKRVKIGSDALMVESLAIRFGLEIAKDSGLFPCLVELECLAAINLIKGITSLCLEAGLVIEDIRRLVAPHSLNLFSFVSQCLILLLIVLHVELLLRLKL
ncbi:Ribonuclease H-like domain containing protein [Parasponia andersonii]|uniref:Ribonuclease H-like domain containing protein n=1 Tax=Parasponia andersonii TaxID=3476 RepID=A0A2P5BA22_PARAD|nr:Ribonuclease H-like domain containing protein [Parasponia andersonii]